MKNIKIGLFIPILVTLLFTGTSFSGERAGSVNVSPMAGGYMFDNSQDIEKNVTGGVGLGYNFNKNWSSEVTVHYGQFDHLYYNQEKAECDKDKIDGYNMHLGAMYNFRPDKKLVPYIAAGVGGVRLEGDTLEDDYATANYGGGLKYHINDNIALRGDARHIYSFEDSENNAAVMLGLNFQFGGEKKRPAPKKKPIPPPVPKKISKPAPAPAPVKKVKPKPKIAKPVPVKKELTIDLQIQFDLDKADIKPFYHERLKKIAYFMKSHPDTRAVIEGHTCDIGNAEYNLKLSSKRAESVRHYLINKFNTNPERIKSKGFGMSQPIADNITEQGREKNRRVLVVVSNDKGKWSSSTLKKYRKISNFIVRSEAKRKAIGPLRVFKDIQLQDSGDKLKIAMIADGPIKKYRSFILKAPDRFVIDIPGNWRKHGKNQYDVDNAGVSQIRFGHHPDKLRIVLDVNTAAITQPEIEFSDQGLVVSMERNNDSIKLSWK